MRTNKTLRIASVLLIAVLMTTCVIGGTFAKYSSTLTTANKATATVAKWDVSVTDAMGGDITQTFNLFSTIEGTKRSVVISENGEEVVTEMRDTVAAERIAPGTNGSFAFTINNDSEVAATCGVTFTVTGADVPLQYSLDNSTWDDSIPAADSSIVEIGGERTITVYWKWDIGEASSSDTNLGEYGDGAAPVVEVSATISVEQVD